MMRVRRSMMAIAAVAVLLAGCDPNSPASGEGLYVVVTTEILKDLVENVGGDRVAVDTIVPPGGDPHSYEPTPADATKVAQAEVAFTNHLLLEEHALIEMVDTNVPLDIPNISLAEHAEPYGATLIPLVEDLGLDVIWLGLAVRGESPDRTAEVRLFPTQLTGPGDFFLYITDALGVPNIYWNSADGFGPSDVATLPVGAHTHLNWAFTEPGEYELTLAASLDAGGTPEPLGTGTVRFAVGVDPAGLVSADTDRVLDGGHTDFAVDLATGELATWTDPDTSGLERVDVAPEHTIIDVPDRAIVTVPDDQQFAFLGPAGTEIWELPQAVLGEHVHGEIDPHTWEDVRNAQAYVELIADTLIEADPAGRATYEANRDAYLGELSALHDYVSGQIAQIPPERRQLVTTHDAFQYLANAYGLEVVGFVVPNPAQEPSAAQVTELTEAVRGVPAVFLEPNLHARASVLRRVAEDNGVATCVIYGDAFDEHTRTYVDMMRHNADELLRCLGGESS
jgi:anchored repeat ABC transporter substrate-binding protein